MQNRIPVRDKLPFVHELAVGDVFAHDDDIELFAVMRFMREKRLAQFAEVPERLHIVRVEDAVLRGRDSDIHRAAVPDRADV